MRKPTSVETPSRCSHLSSILFGVGVFTTILSACTPAAPAPAVPSPATLRATRATDLSGKPVRPDASIITVPFQMVNGAIYLSVEVDGHRGLFLLDTGGPGILVNSEYLQPDSSGEGLDTVSGKANEASNWISDSVMVRLGTHTMQVTHQSAAAAVYGPPFIGVMSSLSAQEKLWGVKALGIFGLPALGPYETIIDYTHRQLTLIPVDTLGQRLAVVTQYRPVTTLPIMYRPTTAHWYMEARLGGVLDTLLIDTGNNINEINIATQPRITTHLVSTGRTQFSDGKANPIMTLDHVVFAGRSYDAVLFSISDERADCLGNPFFNQFGVIGFNFHTHQLVFYRALPKPAG